MAAYKKGHPYYPPKDGKMPGMSKAQARTKRQLALEVQAQVPAQALVRYHVLRACGKPGPRLEPDPETGDIEAISDEDCEPSRKRGDVPTSAEITQSINWLADRGHGLPAQSIQLQSSIRHEVNMLTGSIDLGSLNAGTVNMLRAVLEGRMLPPGGKVIESSGVEVEGGGGVEGEGGGEGAVSDGSADE